MSFHHNHPYNKNRLRPHYPEQEIQDEQNLHQDEEPHKKPDEEMEEKIAEPEIEASQDDASAGLDEAMRKLEDERLRMAAEMDNFKKRLNREHQEQMRYASEKVLSDLLPALDNLDLALQYGSKHEACADMMQGIDMTRRQLLDAVAKNGLVTVGTRGEQFDPAIHEAIGIESDPELEKGAVAHVMQRGYKLNDRLLRPAKVFVNN